ncbi:hypothetical protein F4777DRAFT_136999 [Nemania sp. FL0916]|nr:hypothetical protein F4777DRAFT_136999 [Nemania sp. FL0916]
MRDRYERGSSGFHIPVSTRKYSAQELVNITHMYLERTYCYDCLRAKCPRPTFFLIFSLVAEMFPLLSLRYPLHRMVRPSTTSMRVSMICVHWAPTYLSIVHSIISNTIKSLAVTP